MRRAVLLTVVFCGCATLNTAGMSEPCRDVYNACLNRCPRPPRVEGSNLDGLSKSPVGGPNLDIGTASCTQKCNDDQKSCK